MPHNHKYIVTTLGIGSPMDEICGFQVRPGLFDMYGAMPLQNGVSFRYIPTGEPPVNCCCFIGERRTFCDPSLSQRV